jgi:hypothetical protein
METVTKDEWLILDTLTDSLEGIAQISANVEDSIPAEKVNAIVYELCGRGLVSSYSKNMQKSGENILSEENMRHNTGEFYFGLTPAGAETWERASAVCDKPVDWSSSYVAARDFVAQKGRVDGVSREVCINALTKLTEDKEWQIDMNSLVESEITGFQAKYYKYMPGGYRISFRLTRR